MTDVHTPPASPLPEINKISIGALGAALRAGWRDFKTAPFYGVFFSAFYVLGGFFLVFLGAGTVTWTLAMSLGFPLVAPFAAVGLYEVSRRLEAGAPLKFGEIIGVVISEKDRQIPWMGAIIVIYFLFWTFLAHMIFALFLGPSALLQIGTSIGDYTSGVALIMIVTELIVGGVLAFVLFSLTVVSLPLLLEKEIDFVSAMLLSLRAVRQNVTVMMAWAALIAAMTLVAMMPMFLGLMVVLPLLGHATWHLYRSVLAHNA